MTPDQNDQNPTTIYTDGGPAISGPVNTGGGDFVARDKIIQTEEIAYTVDGLANPYLGLRAFGYEERSIYGGREQLAQEVVDKLTDPTAPQTLLFINSASGSGKSSFVQAGLLPLLERHYADQQIIRHAIFRPSTQPLVMLWDALRKLGAASQPAVFDQATFVPDLTTFPAGQVSMLVIDQFEELFIQSAADQRDQFIDFLNHLPPFAASHTHILATLRVDYLDELFAVQPLWAIATAGIPLRAMRADDLRHAIQKPLQVNHPTKRFAPDLLDGLVQDAGEDAALLPLLQVTLAELWKSGRLISANYRSLTDAIRERADTVINYRDYDRADPQRIRPADEQTALMAILLDLIHVSVDGADRRDVRQRRTRAELTHDSAQRARLAEELVNARLFAATTEIRGGEAVEVIDIIHESLIDNWERLRAAIDEQRRQLQRRARFQLWLGEWVRNGRQDGYLLLTDMQLAEARALVEARDIEVQGEEAQAFYRRSVDYYHASQRRRIRNIWLIAIVMALLFLGATAAAGYSSWLNGQLEIKNTQLDDKNDELDNTNIQLSDTITQLNQTVNDLDATNDQLQQTISVAFSRQLAAQSTSELSKGRYEPAILLAIEAGQITDTLESFSAVRAAIANPWHSRFIFYGHTRDIYQVIWNQDESKILTSSADDTVRIWDAVTGKELLKLDGHTGDVRQALWNQDESKILTSSDDRTARIWDAATGNELLRFEGHTNWVLQAIWNQDESKILTSSDDDTVRIWDAATGNELLTLDGHTGDVRQALWNQNGSMILTSSDDRTARIWDAATGNELLRFEGHTNWVLQAIWNQDESKILTSSADDTVRIWDAATGNELLTLDGHTGDVRQAIWNQDESKILTSSDDRTARIWNAATGNELLRFEGHTNWVLQAIWNQDESKILTSSADDTFRIWDAAIGNELLSLDGHTGDVRQAIWNQDGSKILTSSADDTVRIWDAAIGNELLSLDGHTSWVLQATLSQNEHRILTTGVDGTIRIWDAVTGNELVRLDEHTGFVSQAIWNHDESKVLAASNDHTVRIWDAATGKELLTLDGLTSFTWQVSWNQDGSKILTSCDDAACILDAANGNELLTLDGHTNDVLQAIWNQDESKILTSSADNTVRIWNAITGKELLRLDGHTNRVLQAVWNQNESKILTRSDDHTARIWDAITGKELLRLDGHTGNVLQALWNQDESKILTSSDDHTVRIWDAITGKELLRLDWFNDEAIQATWNQDGSKILTSSGDWHYSDDTARIWDAVTGKELLKLDGPIYTRWQATWNQDGSKILTISDDGAVKIWYTHMSDLLVAACNWTPRNFTWAEWSTYMAENVGTYRPTCPNAPIPPDAIAGIQDEARQLLRAGQRENAIQRLEELNGWLQVNGQFKSYGVNIDAFFAEVSATPVAP